MLALLSIYFGSSEAVFVHIDENRNVKNWKYPYISTNEAFISDLVKLASKEMKIKIEECDILQTGFPEVPGGFLNPKLVMTLDRVASILNNWFSVYANNFQIVSPNGYLSDIEMVRMGYEDINSLSNLVLYRQVIQTDSFDQMSVDHLIRFYPPALTTPDSPKPIIFSGDRFSTAFKGDTASYLFMCDLVKTPGVYEIKMDNNNMLAPLTLAMDYNNGLKDLLLDYPFTNIGTMVNAPGAVECLVETEEGTSQLLDVSSDDLFILPMASGSNTRVLIKNNILGTTERVINGGKLGLIIDTRNKTDKKYFNKGYFEKHLKKWEERITESLCTYQ